MGLNPTPGGDTHNWNYSKPDKDGYSLELIGTVKAIQEVQAMNFGQDGMPTTPKFWENNGQPKMNIRIVLAGPSGGFRTLTFQPASKDQKARLKPSLHIDLYDLSGGVNIMNLVEKTIKITTVAPPQGFSYGIGNPRPWKVELVTDQGPYQLTEPLPAEYLVPSLLANQAVSGGVVAPQPTAVPEQQGMETGVSPSNPSPHSGNNNPPSAPTPPKDDLPF